MADRWAYGPKEVSVKDILIRAAKTFVQTFLSTATVGAVFELDIAALQAAAIAAGAGAVAIIWNAALNWSRS